MAEQPKKLNCTNCPFKLSLFKYLNKEELAFLDENRYEILFNAGETVFKQNGALTHLAALTSGLLKIYIEDSNKNNLLLTIRKPNELVGGPGFMSDFKHHFSVMALESSLVCFIDIKAFEKVMRENSEFAMGFIGYLNKIHVSLHEKLIMLTHKNMHGRVAEAIIYLSKVIYNSPSFTTLLTRQDLADIASLAKESFIRILREFKLKGLVSVEGNSFEIKDMEALEKISLTS